MYELFKTVLIEPLFNLLALIYAIIPGHDFGVAIILLTILVRLALWPVVNKQLHSQKVMQEIGPEAKKIRDQAKGDKQKEAQLLMELYKEKGVSPFSSMLPIFMQLPIFIALFVVLRDIVKPGEFERLGYEFVKNLDFIKAIIADKASFHPELFGIFDLSQTKNVVLAGIAGIAQYFQSKQLAPKHADKQQQAMFKTTGIVFPALTIFIGYTLPAALSLYWAATSGVAMLQQHLVLKSDVEELEEAVDKSEKKGGKGKAKK